MANQENTPLLSKNGAGGAYYFKNDLKNDDGGKLVETPPEGSNEDDFAPRTLGVSTKKKVKANESVGLFAKLFGRRENKTIKIRTVKPRKAPIKIEPKVFFSNERTFLAWMHISIILAGASVAILALAEYENVGKQLYGLIMLPVAIAFLCYSMYQYVKRSYMIRHKLPGPYEDSVGPTILSIMLMVSITAQFSIKLLGITSTY